MTLAWNPIRVLIGVRVQHPVVFVPVPDEPPSRGRKKKKALDALVAPAALLEPPPEEMPQIDPALMQESAGDIADESLKGKKKKKSRAELNVEQRRAHRCGDRCERGECNGLG